jgi:hypothetical protein
LANSQAFTNQAKLDALTAIVPNGDTIKAALYLTTASIGASTTAYSATGEVSGTNYSAGGVTVTHANAASLSGSTAVWTPSASIVYTAVTLPTAFDCMLIYDSTRTNAAVSSHTFGAQTVTAGTLTLTMPVNAAGTALLGIA